MLRASSARALDFHLPNSGASGPVSLNAIEVITTTSTSGTRSVESFMSGMSDGLRVRKSAEMVSRVRSVCEKLTKSYPVKAFKVLVSGSHLLFAALVIRQHRVLRTSLSACTTLCGNQRSMMKSGPLQQTMPANHTSAPLTTLSCGQVQTTRSR